MLRNLLFVWAQGVVTAPQIRQDITIINSQKSRQYPINWWICAGKVSEDLPYGALYLFLLTLKPEMLFSKLSIMVFSAWSTSDPVIRLKVYIIVSCRKQVVVLYEYRSFWWRMTTSSFLLILEGLQCQKKNVWFWYWKHSSFTLLHSDNWAEEESFYDLLVVVSSEVYQVSEPVSKLRSQHCKDVCWKGEG